MSIKLVTTYKSKNLRVLNKTLQSIFSIFSFKTFSTFNFSPATSPSTIPSYFTELLYSWSALVTLLIPVLIHSFLSFCHAWTISEHHIQPLHNPHSLLYSSFFTLSMLSCHHMHLLYSCSLLFLIYVYDFCSTFLIHVWCTCKSWKNNAISFIFFSHTPIPICPFPCFTSMLLYLDGNSVTFFISISVRSHTSLCSLP